MKKRIIYFIFCILFIFLLLFPMKSLEASKEGLLLWFDTLLPTLLPFLILSQLILKTSLIEIIQNITSPFFSKIFHCSVNGSFCILCGFLCGYPVGARLIALQMKEHRLSAEEGQYLLSFCNNVSPMFCISYGIQKTLGTHKILPYLFIVYGSAIFYGLITRPKEMYLSDLKTNKQTSPAENIFQLMDVCIIDSFLIMIKLCGYLILFSIICELIFMQLSGYHPIAPLIAGTLEITGGLSQISKMPPNLLRSALTVTALTFGGLCCIFQTNSVISDTGLSLKKYIFTKTATTLIALLFFFLWQFLRWCLTNGWR